jgi:ribonuclease BN (tRNA processing enzyme)
VTPGMGGVGEAVEAESEGAVLGPLAEAGEFDPVRGDDQWLHGSKRYLSPRRYSCPVEVTFYGVRGSCPTSGDEYFKVGGNTSCVLVSSEGEDPLILDLGTGLRALGESLQRKARFEGRPLRATALLTHLHFDHILGLPFFSPFRDPGATMEVHGPRQPGGLYRTLLQVVQPPFFPIQLTEFRGQIRFHDTDEGELVVGGAKVSARLVPHVGTTLGYRIECDGRVLAYIPDHQAPPDRFSVDDRVLELCRGADLLIHDAQYTDAEYVEHADWGHSTFAYAVRVAAEAGARRLVLFHHDPRHTDAAIARFVDMARHLPDAKALEDISVAHEGSTIDFGRA